MASKGLQINLRKLPKLMHWNIKICKNYSTNIQNNKNYSTNIKNSNIEFHSNPSLLKPRNLLLDEEKTDIQNEYNKIPFKIKLKKNNQNLKKNNQISDNAKITFSSLYKSNLKPYIALSKPRLTMLVVLTTMGSYALVPSSLTNEPLSIPSLLLLTVGTALASASANAINMGREPTFDARMRRTCTRPVVRGIVSPRASYIYAFLTGIIGIFALYAATTPKNKNEISNQNQNQNQSTQFTLQSQSQSQSQFHFPTVAALGTLNIILYAGLYTSLKRKTIVNTWVGALVGAIPPLMGWAAATNGDLSHPAAWCLAGLLYCWQFPHFNSLSYVIRDEYKRAGYVMACWTNPKLNARVALRHAIAIIPICCGLSYFGVTDPVFAIDSNIVNIYFAFLAYKFWKYSSKNSPQTLKYAQKLFWVSVWQLPIVMMLTMIHKAGLWDSVFQKFKSKNTLQA